MADSLHRPVSCQSVQLLGYPGRTDCPQGLCPWCCGRPGCQAPLGVETSHEAAQHIVGFFTPEPHQHHLNMGFFLVLGVHNCYTSGSHNVLILVPVMSNGCLSRPLVVAKSMPPERGCLDSRARSHQQPVTRSDRPLPLSRAHL